MSQKYIGLLENAEGGSGAGGIDYSETEQDTGLKWTVNKAVYQKTIINTDTVTTSGITISDTTGLNLISIDALVVLDGGSIIPIPYYNGSTEYIQLWMSSNSLKIAAKGYTVSKTICNIRYTKSA